MRTTSLEWLACPVAGCNGDLAVSLSFPAASRDGELDEGVLACRRCGKEYPVLLGVALLEVDLESWLAAFWAEVEACEASCHDASISLRMRRWLGAPGAGSGLPGPRPEPQPSLQWSTAPYLQAHFDRQALAGDLPEGWWREAVTRHGRVADPYSWLLGEAATLSRPAGLAVDVGCNVGRGAAELAHRHRYAMGVDRSFPAVFTARRLHLGRPEPLERYLAEAERGRWEARQPDHVPPAEGLDFVVGAGSALPVAGSRAACVAALNVLCAVPNPQAMVSEFARALQPGGTLLVASPYWSEPAEPGSPAWDGPEALLEALAGDFKIDSEEDMVPWVLRLTRRRWNVYLSHCVVATRSRSPEPENPVGPEKE